MWAHALRRRNPAPGEQLRKLTSALVRAIGAASLKVDQCRREIPTRCLTSAIMEHLGPSPPSTASGAFIEHHRRARSEAHTSQLQSLMRIAYAVFCLKKKSAKPLT